MPGGLFALIAYGNENLIVNGNPQLTFFYKAFMRHTHFSQEPIQIPIEGPNNLQMDSSVIFKAKIPRQGDLLSDLTFRFTIPDIYSKAITHVDPVTGEDVLDQCYEFAWVRAIGVRMIDTVTFTIGGQIIQEFTSDWIAARAALDMDNTRYSKWRTMVGDVPECFDPANGVYADFSTSPPSYPNVVLWKTQSQQTNAPSIPQRLIRVPLGLWFSDFIANSLPLVGLEYHEAEIAIKLRPIRDLYTILDPNGIRVRPGIQRFPYLPTDQYTGVWDPELLGDLPDTLNNLYGSISDPNTLMKNFLTDFNSGTPFSDAWPLNASLEGLYTFLQDEERLLFAKKTLRYNVRQVQNFIFSGITSRDTYRLDVHNISTRLVWFTRRSDALTYRNDATNLTNWIYTQGSQRPYIIPDGGYVTVPGLGRSGLVIPGIQRGIITNVFLTANGQQLFDSEDDSYFTQYVPYRNLQGYGAPYGDLALATQTELWPIYTYSFADRGSSVEQPTGTLNISRIDRLELDVDVQPIPVLANYTYELQVFVETLNFLEITNGLGGLKFAK
jgi:hypothetical protein